MGTFMMWMSIGGCISVGGIAPWWREGLGELGVGMALVSVRRGGCGGCRKEDVN